MGTASAVTFALALSIALVLSMLRSQYTSAIERGT